MAETASVKDVRRSSRASGGTHRLSIVHVLAPAAFGGLEQVVESLAAGHTRAGHRVHVLAVVTPDSSRREHPFVESLRRAGVDTASLRLPGRAYREERRQVAEFCRKVGADVIHTHGYRPDVLDSGVAAALGIPRISTVHGFTGGGWKNRLYEKLQLRSLRRFDAVVAVARPQLRRLATAGIDLKKTHLVPNAWQPTAGLEPKQARAELGIPPSAFHVAWVGRLSHEKGADVFMDAIAGVVDLPIIVSIIGDGPERMRLEAQASALALSDRVRWHGALSGAGRYFGGFDAFVLSSRTEGTPMVLFEAMAARAPIVATSVGGVPDIISETEGLLVAPENPRALAAAIRAVYEAGPDAAERSERAHRRLQRDYAAAPWLERYELIYREAINLRAQ